jgi:hypothetical protein
MVTIGRFQIMHIIIPYVTFPFQRSDAFQCILDGINDAVTVAVIMLVQTTTLKPEFKSWLCGE